MSGGTNTNTQTLPNWLMPYLTSELGAASSLTPGLSGSSGGTYTLPDGQSITVPGTPGVSAQSLVAGMTPAEQQGLSSQMSAANQGAGEASSAASANQFETSGALLNPAMNPYLQNTYNLAANNVQNTLDSQFAANGSNVLNSLPVQSDQLNNLATQLYGGAYQQGLQTMTQAAANSPLIQQGLYQPGQEQYQVGNIQQQQQQNVINAPYNALSWYSGLLGLNGSSLGGSSQSNNGNATSQDVGMGLAAAGTAAEIAAAY
jgi:hypothetical protein